MNEGEIKFGVLAEDGEYKEIRTLNNSDIKACPHFILVPEHYREDHSCRCNDPDHTEMKSWGYTWNGSQWV